MGGLKAAPPLCIKESNLHICIMYVFVFAGVFVFVSTSVFVFVSTSVFVFVFHETVDGDGRTEDDASSV